VVDERAVARPGRPQRPDPETAAGLLRERVYATLTGLSTVLILLPVAGSTTVAAAAASVGVTMLGLFAASLVAELVAHAALHGEAPRRDQFRRMRMIAGQALETASGPLVLIGLSATGLWTLRTGLILATGALVLTLVVVSAFAVRRSTLGPLGRFGIVAGELVLAGVVIAIKLLAH
jgi:hypothetical protein